MLDLNKQISGKNLTAAEEQVLYYIVEHIDEVLKMGVRGVAKANYTSSSTIMRLTKKMGYSGFVDMYYKLLPQVQQPQTDRNTDFQFVNSFCSNTILQYNQYDDIRRFARRLAAVKGQYVFIYATGFSAMLGEYFNRKLLVMGCKCIFSSGRDSIGVFENNLSDMGLLLVLSRSGETERVIDRVKIAKENGIFVTAITNELDNHVNELADIRFRIEDNMKLDDRNIMANTFFPNVLMLLEVLIYEYHKVSREQDA